MATGTGLKKHVTNTTSIMFYRSALPFPSYIRGRLWISSPTLPLWARHYLFSLGRSWTWTFVRRHWTTVDRPIHEKGLKRTINPWVRSEVTGVRRETKQGSTEKKYSVFRKIYSYARGICSCCSRKLESNHSQFGRPEPKNSTVPGKKRVISKWVLCCSAIRQPFSHVVVVWWYFAWHRTIIFTRMSSVRRVYQLLFYAVIYLTFFCGSAHHIMTHCLAGSRKYRIWPEYCTPGNSSDVETLANLAINSCWLELQVANLLLYSSSIKVCNRQKSLQ